MVGGAGMDWVKAFKDYVPLFQTLIWSLLVILGFGLFRKQLNNILESVHKRIGGSASGGTLKANLGIFSLEIGEDLRHLQYVKTSDENATSATNMKEDKLPLQWTETRKQRYVHNRDVFLAHVLVPSKSSQHEFDIFIFLIRHQGFFKHEDIDSSINIDYAEFFLGQAWGNRTFKIINDGGPVGLSTSAFGTFLVVCRVMFKDGYEVIIDRYIDFEMGKKLVNP